MPRPLLLLCCWLSACSTPPVPMRAPASPLAAFERVLAIDFRPASRLPAALKRVASGAHHELGRIDRATERGTGLAGELQRLPRAEASAAQLAGDELRRRPDFAALAPEPHRLGQDLADALVDVPVHLGFAGAPLDEIDDRRHRTDPHDDRPQRSFWQRLSRRLWLWR